MKVALDIVNLKTPNQMKKNSVILYNGKDFYVTTINDILKPAFNEINALRNELISLNTNYNKLANFTANSVKDMATLMKKDLEAKK